MNAFIDILCPVKKGPSTVKSVTRTAQPGEIASIWPLRGETRGSEQILQPVQRQIQPHKYVVWVEVQAPMEPPETEVPIEPQVPD